MWQGICLSLSANALANVLCTHAWLALARTRSRTLEWDGAYQIWRYPRPSPLYLWDVVLYSVPDLWECDYCPRFGVRTLPLYPIETYLVFRLHWHSLSLPGSSWDCLPNMAEVSLGPQGFGEKLISREGRWNAFSPWPSSIIVFSPPSPPLLWHVFTIQHQLDWFVKDLYLGIEPVSPEFTLSCLLPFTKSRSKLLSSRLRSICICSRNLPQEGFY